MEYFRAPAFCQRTRVMTDPGAIGCLCGKPLDLQRSWLQHGAGADSRCVCCQRCYDSRGLRISALRDPAALTPPLRPSTCAHPAALWPARSGLLWAPVRGHGTPVHPLAVPPSPAGR